MDVFTKNIGVETHAKHGKALLNVGNSATFSSVWIVMNGVGVELFYSVLSSPRRVSRRAIGCAEFDSRTFFNQYEE